MGAEPPPPRRWLMPAAALSVAALIALAAATFPRVPAAQGTWSTASPRPSTAPAGPAPAVVRPAPAGLPVIGYEAAPRGFPADPAPASAEPLTEGLHPSRRIPAYDAPGGRPVAYLAPDIRGVRLTMPIAARGQGWTAVLLPSANRSLGWLPPGGWTTEPLRDQLIVERAAHTLRWRRDGALVQSWPVTLGTAASPTPLGRTFIIGRSRLPGRVYAGTDVLALGSVPDDVAAIPAGLRGAHIGIHTWHNDRALGKNTSDGCIRLTKAGQQRLLAELTPGTEVVVVN